MGFSAPNSPPSLRAKPPTSTPRVPVSVRRLSSFSAAWHKGVLSVPGEGRARRLSWPCRYFAFQGVKELNFSDGKRTEDQTSSLVTSRHWDSSNSPAQARQFHPSAVGAGGEQQPVGARGGRVGHPAGPALASGGTPGAGGRRQGVMVCGMEGAPGGSSLIPFQKRGCSSEFVLTALGEVLFLAFWDARSADAEASGTTWFCNGTPCMQ